MKIAYITKEIPWGKDEAFIIDEMKAIKRKNIELFIIPRNPPRKVIHKEAESLLADAKWLQGISIGLLIYFLIQLLYRPKIWIIWLKISRGARSFKILLKNSMVLPKAVYAASLFKKYKVDHIHAHWGTTTATLGYISSELTGIPWSFTLHRFDIAENNLLKIKAQSADFIRVIAKDGQNEFLSIVGDAFKAKTHLIHMGVYIDEHRLDKVEKNRAKNKVKYASTFKIVCPAFFEVKKGHEYLIDACKILIDKDIKNFTITFIGNGSLEKKLKKQVEDLALQNYIYFAGLFSHNKIITLYDERLVDAVVLPSIIDQNGEREGIPVSLIEAMSYAIPVISTRTGGIAELLDQDAGILVDEKDPLQLAHAIEILMSNQTFVYIQGRQGYEKIQKNFNIDLTVHELLEQMRVV